MTAVRSATPPLRAVTFDYWNTLISADDGGVFGRRLEAWLGLLAGEGIEHDIDAVTAALVDTRRNFEDHWRANQIYRAEDAVADAVAALGLDLPSAVIDGLVEGITRPDPVHVPQPTPNIGATLERLRAADIRIGIICDVGLSPSTTLRHHLEGHGLLGLFDHWSFSDEVGCFKPDPAIFAHALDGLGGIEPGAAAHVGDLRRTDIAGAQGAGLFAVRYTAMFDDPGDAEHGTDTVDGDAVIADHTDLPRVLGLA